MNANSIEIDLLLNSRRVVARRDHPELAGALDWSIRQGRLVPLLPGIYARPIDAENFEVRARALQLWIRHGWRQRHRHGAPDPGGDPRPAA